jgi:branched-subunit amino acid transport protein
VDEANGGNNLSKNIIKFVVICGLPAIIIYGLGFIVWTSSYITVPVFFPFSPYSRDTATWSQTIFHTSNYGWYFFAGYSILIAAVVTWITREKSWLVSLGVYCGVLAVASIMVHVALQMLGYHYYMDVP